MSATRILWGQITAVFALTLGGVWGATQWTAAQLGYQAALGPPLFTAWDTPVYPPYAIFWWWFGFDAYAPRIFDRGGVIAASGGLVSVLAAIAMSVWRARELRNSETYGSARWATRSEIARAGLLSGSGVVIGRYAGAYLRHDGPEHVLCFAPTRSGKGVGLVVPTLLTWPHSAIVHDIKGENWELTAGFRSRFGRVLLFDPTNEASAAYNPLAEVRRGTKEVRDVQNIADVLVDPEGSLERRNHWEKTSHSLLVGAILHVLYAEPDKTLAGVASFLSDPSRSIEATLAAMMTTPHLAGECVHPVVASAARELLNKSENERSGVLSTAMSFLGLYRDPVIAKVTRRCDWRIADLVDPEQPVTLYLVVPPSDISRTKPLVRLILNQVGRRLTEDLGEGAARQRLLLMLDEFPALGRLDFFESALAFMAGYGIKAFLIAQSLNQIEKAYGQNNAILDNCHVRVCFATNDERTAKRISESLGTATELRAMKNYAGHRLSPWLGHLMVSRTETARALLTQGEIMQLPGTDEIVMLAGAHPIRATKARYYADPRLETRVEQPPSPPIRERPVAPSDWDGSLALRSASPGAPDESGDVQETGETGEGGLRQEPALADPEDIAPEPRLPRNEFDFDAPSDAETASRNRAITARVLANARRAALDPADGIDM